MITLFLTLIVVFCVAFGAYLIYAFSAKPKKWPFLKSKKVETEKTPSGAMMTVTRSHSASPASVGGSILVVVIVIIFVALFIVGFYFSIKLTMKRYEIAGEAARQGNTGVALAAMAPELGQGIGSILGGITGNTHY